MKTRLFNLFFEDGANRLRMYTVSAVTAIGLGWLSLLLGASPEESLRGSVVAAFLIITAWTLVYCTQAKSVSLDNVGLVTPRRAMIAMGVIAAATALGLELKNIEAAIINRKLKRLGDPKKMDDRTIEMVTSAIIYAKDNDLPGDLRSTTETGISFLEMAYTQPKALEAAQGYLGYRTNFNRNLIAVKNASEIATTPYAGDETHYAQRFLPGFATPRITVGGSVPADRGVRMNRIGVDENVQRHDEVMLVEGGGYYLDEVEIRHVVFRYTTLAYDGGPLILEGVVFVNCSFILRDTPIVNAFARQVFTSSSVNFLNLSPS
jgi:hypothetical protein